MEIDKNKVKNEKPRSDTLPTMKIPSPFPQRVKRKEENDKLKKFIAQLSNLCINTPILKAIEEILGYAKLMKKLMSKKNIVEGDTIQVTHVCSTIMSSTIAEKNEDSGLL